MRNHLLRSFLLKQATLALIIVLFSVGSVKGGGSLNLHRADTARYLAEEVLHADVESEAEREADGEEEIGIEIEEMEGEGEEEEGEDIFRNTTVVCAIILVLISFTLFFEYTKEYLEEICHKEGPQLSRIVQKLFGEMTVLGFLSLTTFAVTQAGLLDSLGEIVYGEGKAGELEELLETVHFSIFYVMIAFVAQVFLLIGSKITNNARWVKMDQYARSKYKKDGDNDWKGLDEIGVTEEEERLFIGLREEFILERDDDPPFEPADPENRVPEDFNFGRYLSENLGSLLTNCVDIGEETWTFFAIGTIGYYIYFLLVDEDLDVVVWSWTALAWFFVAFNFFFEAHLREVLLNYAKPIYHKKLPHHETTPLDPTILPKWCYIDIDEYMKKRSWINKYFVGGRPGREQSLLWMDQKGPQFYQFILQVNLVFTGMYLALLAERFVVHMIEKPWHIFAFYIVIATLPAYGMVRRTRIYVPLMSQVLCLGMHRRPQIITAVLRERKITRVVRAFLALNKLGNVSKNKGSSVIARSNSEHIKRVSAVSDIEMDEISRTFDLYDESGDGILDYDEIRNVMERFGVAKSEEEIQRVISVLDVDKDGTVTKDEFLRWYLANKEGDEEMDDKEIAASLFNMLDADGSGEITIGELKQQLDQLQVGLTLDDIGDIVKELDHDNTGNIGLEEFEELVEKYGPKNELL